MFSAVKKLLVLGLLIGFVATIVHTAQNDLRFGSDEPFGVNPFIEEIMLSSSRFTQPEDLRDVELEHYVEITSQDTYLFENDTFALYMNQNTYSFKVEDLRSGYVWNTAIDSPQAGGLNTLFRTGIGLEYINILQGHSRVNNIPITDMEYTSEIHLEANRVQIDFQIDYYCPPGRCENYRRQYLAGDERYTFEGLLESGYLNLDMSLRLEVELTEKGIVATVPYEHLEERNTDIVRLASIIVFPGLGATRMDDIPGYMFVPDGVGALIRYEDNERRYTQIFNERFFGDNVGAVSRVAARDINYPLSMPIFGAVHGVYQNAFLAIIEEGALNARLQVYPNGVRNQNHNLIFTKYDIRQVFTQPFSRDGSVGSPRIHQLSTSDVRVRYDFLTGDDADYVGMANHYQQHLATHGDLSRLNPDYDQIPIHLQFLMADSKSQFIGTSTVEMTSVDDVKRIYDTFMAAGVTNQRISLLGWNRGGYSGHLPSPVRFERSIGSSRDFESLIAHINEVNSVMLVNNYVYAGDSASRITSRTDIALGVNRLRLSYTCSDCVHPVTSILYPHVSHDLALRDLEHYKELGADVMFETLGSMLFSYYRREMFTRIDAYNHYQTTMEAYDGIGNYSYPHAYAYRFTDAFYHMPIYNSQLVYYDDIVPFLPIVLRGHMELYSQFLNFNSLGQVQLLMLIDFGINPSFVLTQNRPSLLMGTDSQQFFTTQFSIWEDTIVEQYNYINDALQHVIGETIVTRDVLAYGVVKISYANGVSIIVNYSQFEYDYNGEIIAPTDYYVSEVTS